MCIRDRLSPTHPHSPSDLLMVHAVCGTHTHSEHHWPIAVMLTLSVWHDLHINLPPQLERQNWAKNCRLIRKYGSTFQYTFLSILHLRCIHRIQCCQYNFLMKQFLPQKFFTGSMLSPNAHRQHLVYWKRFSEHRIFKQNSIKRTTAWPLSKHCKNPEIPRRFPDDLRHSCPC